MNTTMGTRVRRCRSLGSAGFSIVELVIAILVSAVIGLGLYAIFHAQERASESQKTYNNLQTSATFAMDTLKSDLLLAGYRAKDSQEPISVAEPHTVTFEFFDDNAGQDTSFYPTATYDNFTRVTYALDPDPTLSTGPYKLTKTTLRWRKGTPGGPYDNPLTVVLAENVQQLNFQYLAQDNTAWDASQAKSLIRSVRVSLKLRAMQSNAIFNSPQLKLDAASRKWQEITLTAEVRPRNIAVSLNPEDKTPPLPPTGLNVWDPGQCGCLQLQWNANSEGDIAGYTVFYGLSAGNYIGRARVVHVAGAAIQTYQLTNLSESNAPYFIALQAFDNSGNPSSFSSPAVSANPTPSVRAAGGANDTAITPLTPPPAPGALAVSTPADNQLQLSWTNTYSDCMSTPVFGYRIYRSTNAAFTPTGIQKGQGNCIADERTLDASTVSYLDTGADTVQGKLVGCVPYYYKIAVVNCDPAQLSNYTNPGGSTTTIYTAAQFASISGTPTDGTPTNPPLLTSKAGYRRIILSVTNPSRSDTENPDFTHTRIYFSPTAYPVLTETRDADGYNVVTGGTLIPDGGGQMADGGGPHTINFDDEDSEIPNGTPAGIGNPQLSMNSTYYFLAVAYDRCKNHSEISNTAKTEAEQCKDCLVGETCRDAPPGPESVHITEGCKGAPVKIEWDYASSNYTTHPDMQGFRVVRCEGDGCTPRTSPDGSGILLTGTYLTPDKFLLDDTVVDGVKYTYRIEAGDCYYQRWREGLLTGADISDNDPSNNASSSDVTNVALGAIERERVVGNKATPLVGNHDPVTQTINVISTTGFTRNTVQIGSEVLDCTGVTATSFTGCTRGAEATVAIGHFDGDWVRSYPPAPPRAATSGNLTLSPPTFRHNIVNVAAKNTSADSLLLKQLEMRWDNLLAWFKTLLYGAGPVITAYDAPLPLTDSGSGSTIPLTITVPDKNIAYNVPLSFRFFLQDGTMSALSDMREANLELVWWYKNNATGVESCSLKWIPPDPRGVTVPIGPVVSGVTQSRPSAGTPAWAVPGNMNNPIDAVVVPGGSTVRVSAFVDDRSLAGIAGVRLYYYKDCHGAGCMAQAPAVTGNYPVCTPYTEVDMTRISGTDLYYADIPKSPAAGSTLDDSSIWYFIVAADAEGNFDRDPEVDLGAYQYRQLPPDPCQTTPAPPTLVGSATGTSVTLDWSSSWTGANYFNNDSPASVCTDLGGFRIFHKIGSTGGWHDEVVPPLANTVKTYTVPFVVSTTSLTGSGVTTDTATVINVSDTTNFDLTGKIIIDGEIISYTAKTATSFTGCTRGLLGGAAAGTHAGGAAVTQDILDLEKNSFYVRAYDQCSPTAKYSDSAVYTEGECSPTCDFRFTTIEKHTPATTTFAPGDSFSVKFLACEKAGNGLSGETLYLQTCSPCDVDAIGVTEAGDTGVFTSPEMKTYGVTTCAGGGGLDTLTVPATGASYTISVGGYSDSLLASWNTTCAALNSYSCGAASTITVVPPGAAAPCDTVTAPTSTPAPTDLTGTVVGSCTACDKASLPAGCNTQTTHLTWTGVAAPPSTLYKTYYEVYYCTPGKTGTCTPGTLAGTTTGTSFDVTGLGLLAGSTFYYGVKAVYDIDTTQCPSKTPSPVRSALSATVGDPCP